MTSTLLLEALVAGEYYGATNLAYDGAGNVQYRGLHPTLEAKDTEPGWKIWRFYFDGNNNLLKIRGYRVGIWADRAALNWPA